MAGFSALQEEIISTGLCTDCGTCVAVCPNNIVTMNYETEEPELTGKCAIIIEGKSIPPFPWN